MNDEIHHSLIDLKDINVNQINLTKFILNDHYANYLVAFHIVGYLIQLVTCTIGNCLELYILPKIKQPDDYITYAFLTLSFCDLLQGLITVPVNFLRAVFYDWFMGEFCCKFFTFFFYSNTTTCIWITVYIAFDRFINICYPFQVFNLKTTRFCITVLCCIVFGNAILFVYIYFSSEIVVDSLVLCKICHLQMRESEHLLHVIIVHVIHMYALPVVLLAIFYGFILYTLLKIMSFNEILKTLNVEKNSFNNKSDSSNNKPLFNLLIEKIFLLLVIIFFFANLPLFIYKIMDFVHHEMNGDHLRNGFRIMKALGYFMQTLTSCLNPWIYSIYSKKFRKELKKIFCGTTESRQTMSSLVTNDMHFGLFNDDEID